MSAKTSGNAFREKRERPLVINGRTPIAGPPPGPDCFYVPPEGSFYWGGYWYAPIGPLLGRLPEYIAAKNREISASQCVHGAPPEVLCLHCNPDVPRKNY